MSTRTRPANGAAALAEMREFAGFGKGTQRYIRRALDIGLGQVRTEGAASAGNIFGGNIGVTIGVDGAAIIDDYAHNPFKIAAALRASTRNVA